MALSTLMRCETSWQAVLSSFNERDEKFVVDHLDMKKDMDLI
jgi:hypothetical protein